MQVKLKVIAISIIPVLFAGFISAVGVWGVDEYCGRIIATIFAYVMLFSVLYCLFALFTIAVLFLNRIAKRLTDILSIKTD